MCTAHTGKVAAARRKEAEKAAAARSGALQRRQRALRKLGLVPPPGSPYAEQPCLDMAQTWFAQVCHPWPIVHRGCQVSQQHMHPHVCSRDSSYQWPKDKQAKR